jgi:hypothetical protein|tara:strand:- start:445 stop:1185 length:741 start_codon:yes stop_codon:yes gene_type:complete
MGEWNKKEVLDKLVDDEQYYGAFGRQFRSNSDIMTLLTNPLALGTPQKPNINFLVGGYFHTAILEPNKLKKYKIVESSTRNTKAYKEISGGEMCLLQHEVDNLEMLIDTMKANNVCKGLIEGINVEYEQPGIKEIEGLWWKGKADIVNHDERLIVDLKTTSDITKFRSSAFRYNYDSQAYIYRKIFGYDLIFIAIDKKTGQIGIFDCSDAFYESGKDKVQQAVEQYKLFYDNPDFDPKDYFINKTL